MTYLLKIFIARFSWIRRSLPFFLRFSPAWAGAKTHTETQTLLDNTSGDPEGRECLYDFVGKMEKGKKRHSNCSLSSTGLCLGNGLVLGDQTLKHSDLETPELCSLRQYRKGVWDLSSLYSLQGAGNSAPTISTSVSFQYIQSQFN